MIAIPKSFVESTIQREGENGRKWIAELPGLVDALCQQWELTIDGQPMHGYFALVVPVLQKNQPRVLKVSWINQVTKDEAAALALWDGNGIVQLFDVWPEQGAMLLERLDYSRSLTEAPIAEAIQITADILRRLAIPAPARFPSLRDIGPAIGHSLPERWEMLGRPFSRRLLETTRHLALELGPAAQNLMVNYDIHYIDTLAGEREPWLAVDPKPIAGDPEYGIAQLLWQRLEDIQEAGGLAYHFDLLVETAELDPHLARGWTLVRIVDYWLWGLNIGLTEDPVRCQIIANWLMTRSKM